jgi:uncharacterized membrane protein (GlpM family)
MMIRRPKRWWHFGLTAVVGFLLIKHLVARLVDTTGDFASFWWAGRLFLLGQDIYAPIPGVLPNVYPPLHALLMAPFALLPEKAAFLLWQMGQLFAIGMSFRLLELILDIQDEKSNDRYWLTLLLAFPALIDNWAHGQYNHVLLLGITFMLWFLRCRKEMVGGCLLGILLSVKPFQILPLMAWLAIKRSWRALLGGSVAALCGIIVVPLLIWGWKGATGLLNRWHQQVAPHAFEVSWVSVSLTSTLYRMLTHCNVSDQPEEQIFVNLFNLPSWIVTFLLAVLIAVAVSLTVWICRRPIQATSPLELLYEVGWILTVTLTFSPRTEGHHWVLLLPVFFLIAHYLVSEERATKSLSRKVGLAWVFYAIIDSDLLPKWIRSWLRTAYWAEAVALVLLCFSLLSLLDLVYQDRLVTRGEQIPLLKSCRQCERWYGAFG